jgi:molybdopterin synthase sulfur carrier subunit
VKIRVLYFASIREKVGTGAEEVELPAGIATVDGLRLHLRERGGAWAEALAEGKLLRMAVNQEMVQGVAAVKAGDEVAFFPPVTGG